MVFQRLFRLEHLPTRRIVARVDPAPVAQLVILVMAGRGEAFSTHFAIVGILARVVLRVLAQSLPRREHLSASFTTNTFFLSVGLVHIFLDQLLAAHSSKGKIYLRRL